MSGKARARAKATQRLRVIRANGSVENVYEHTVEGKDAQATWERIKGHFPEGEHPDQETLENAFIEEDE